MLPCKHFDHGDIIVHMGKAIAQKGANVVKDGIRHKDFYATALGDITKAYFVLLPLSVLNNSLDFVPHDGTAATAALGLSVLVDGCMDTTASLFLIVFQGNDPAIVSIQECLEKPTSHEDVSGIGSCSPHSFAASSGFRS